MRTDLKTLMLLLLPMLFSCSNKEVSCGYKLIAHAGGAIEGYIYTNSREAMEQAAEKGYRFIELDLAMTADSVLVAAYDWEKFNAISGYACKKDTAPTLQEFLSRRIYNRYTPVTAADICEFFLANDHLTLVTDKISDATILERYFTPIKSRMMVETFTHEDYVNLQSRGFGKVMYSCLATDIDETLVKHLLLHRLFGDKIETLALHTSAVDYTAFKIIDALCDYRVALFTINDTTEIPEALKKRIDYIYTDSLGLQ